MSPDQTSPTTASRVAEITLAFWVMKICATTLGETAGDLMSMTLGVGYPLSSAILLAAFGIALACQMLSRRFHPALYWTVILCTSTAGTTLSDTLDRSLGLGYATGAALLTLVLLGVLFAWHRSVGTLSVATVRSRRAEAFYWAAILVSNTLGTALGDFLADDSGLGFLGGAALIGGLIALAALAYRVSNVSRVALFWIAFVLTRPFGATFGDLMTKTPAQGGLGFGTIVSSGALLALLLLVFAGTYRRGSGMNAPAPGLR